MSPTRSLSAVLLYGLTLPVMAASRPNVLIVFADDQRAGTIRALGNPHIQTPHLDRLVTRGTAFTRAYMLGGMTGATCVPSRAMLHTGRHLFHLRNAGRSFHPSDTTIGETLRAAGYRSYFTGKRHSLSRDMLRRSFSAGGVVMGFGGYLTDKRRMPLHDWDPAARYAARDAFVVSGAPGHPHVPVPSYRDKDRVPAGPYATELYIDPAVRWLRSGVASQPWFLYVALSAPHDPHEAPAAYRRLYDPKRIPLPASFLPRHPFDNGDLDVRDERLLPWPREPAAVRRRIADYYACISFIDAQFGRLIQTLDETGQLERTIVLFAGDSGLALGQHGLLGKQSLYDDAGVHVPLVLSGPGVPRGQRRAALAATVDIFPTLCDLTATPTPRGLDGRSLVPLLHDPAARVHERLYLGYLEHQRALIESRYKLIEYVRATRTVRGRTVTAGTRATQLFDLAADPAETHNLAEAPARAGTLARLRAALAVCRRDWDDGTERGRRLCPEMDAQYRRFWENYHD